MQAQRDVEVCYTSVFNQTEGSGAQHTWLLHGFAPAYGTSVCRLVQYA